MPKRLACLVCSLLSSATAFQAPPRVVNAALGSRSEHVLERKKHVLAAKRDVLPDLAQQEFPPLPDKPYDLVVLGSGPGGEAAAVQAARLGASVAVVEIKKSFGGPTGLTSKAVREAAKQINQAVTNVGGDKRRQTRRMWKLRFPALRAQAEVLQAAETRDRLAKNLIDLYIGEAEILPQSKRPKEERQNGEIAVRVCRPKACIDIPAHYVCVATGSRPNRPPKMRSGSRLPFMKGVVVDATEMGTITDLPNACAIIGGGVIAVEYANVLAGLGVGVSLLCKDEEFMPFLSEELRVELKQRMIRDKVLFVPAPIKRIDIVATSNMVLVQLEKMERQLESKEKKSSSAGGFDLAAGLRRLFQGNKKKGQSGNSKNNNSNSNNNENTSSPPPATTAAAAAAARAPPQPRRLRVDLVLYSGGRDANTETLGCDAAGVDLARYGRVKVDGSFRTSNPRVYAIGDVTGPPGLASSAQMGGRAVATYLFNDKMQKLKQFMLETSTEMEDVVDDPFFAAEAESASGAQRTSEQLQQYEQTAMLGSDDSMADAAGGAEGESLFERVAGAPLTLWTIPEISSVGLTEEQAFAEGMRKASQGGSMVTGYAYFKDIARGRLSGGDAAGFLKLVARADGPTRHVVVGVQIIGEGANELIQMGSILIQSKSSLEEVSNTPFAAVTLSALYQVAADDGLCNSPYNMQRHPMRTKAYEQR